MRSVNHGNIIDNLMIAYCNRCRTYSLWYNGQMIFPDSVSVDTPNEDLPEEIKADYIEASNIHGKSPRGAAALLRLSIQKLCIHLGENGKDINEDIKSLVKKGLPETMQRAFDIVRITGNEAVHPGTLDLKDSQETVGKLFKLLNMIAEKMISEPKEVSALYDQMPSEKIDAVIKRDGK
jgi:Domain of unknown function (DUF4145)